MNHVRRIWRSLARRAVLPGSFESRASQRTGRAAHRAGGSGRGCFAGLFIQDVAAAASVAAGHPIGRPGQGARPAEGGRGAAYPPPAMPGARSAGREWLAATATTPAMTPPSLLPRTIQLCVHCRRRPAGFWVSRKGGQTVRRPWCLSCCPKLDRARCDVIPFDR